MDEQQLNAILGRKGYAIKSALGKGIKSSLKPAFGPRSVDLEDHRSGASGHLEQSDRLESLRAQGVQIGYTGKCVVRIKFYRHRLADYSRANCEKYLIDSAVYAGLIRDDSEAEILLIDEGQVKVESKDQERVEITFEYQDVDYANPWVKKVKFGNASK